MTNTILYNNKADSIILDKSSKLEKEFEFVGTFRNEVSVINPIILIEVVDDIYNINVVDNTGSNIVDNNLINIVTKEDRTRLATKCNYIYIEEFNRYYYITDIICVRNDLYELHCKIDVLYSYKDAIKSLRCLVERNEFKYNALINDDSYLLNPITEVIIKDMELVEMKEVQNETLRSVTNNILLTVAGHDGVI